ncbi:MAG TPA: lipopolysaccharide heptosyltransferase II [Xanthobacteraceae bacterium]|jgi:heptosyltransferase-2|nr:lipopolysaccharide heptosyltransferase II [Xanthobacteraceae bacterium]
MNDNSYVSFRPGSAADSSDGSPILIVPYLWIGDFVRCHSVVKLLRQRFPDRAVDMLASTLCAPLADYMPGVRQAVVVDLPRSRLALGQHRALAERLKREGYGMALIMPRTWKAALAPYFAGIPQRTGFTGEARFFLLNDRRPGEKKLPRMVDRCGALALPPDAKIPADWPLPELMIPREEAEAWRKKRGLDGETRPVVALAPGAVGPSKRWPKESYAVLARKLLADGFAVWILGGPNEKALAADIIGGTKARDLTGNDLRDAILALARAATAVSNDSGLLHVAAALGTPSIGIFGPTSPWHWAPLNPLAGTMETTTKLDCRPCHKPACRLLHHRCMRDIASDQVISAVQKILATVLPSIERQDLGPQDLGQPA